MRLPATLSVRALAAAAALLALSRLRLRAGMADIRSLIGQSKYGEDFKHYDYVNPDAPKGGTLNSAVLGTFDSFNPFIVQRNAGRGRRTIGGGMLYDTLMDQSTDEARHQPRADRRRLQAIRTIFPRPPTG